MQMGDSWRIGIDQEQKTSLVRHGVFKLSRNPIFLGTNNIAVRLAAGCESLTTTNES
jgi:protein-S-isoprenylcysteine O-methyltransferase Ste14